MIRTLDLPDWIPARLLDSETYSTVGDVKEWDSPVTFKRVGDGMQIVLRCGPPKPGGIAEDENNIPSFMSFSRESVDGYPIGGSMISDFTSKSTYVVFSAPRERAYITVSGPSMRDGRRRWVEPILVESDREWTADLARETIARWAARRLSTAPSPAQIGELSVRAFSSLQGNRCFIDLNDLGQKAGFSIHCSESGTRCSFAYGGKNFVVPLASASVKRGATWVALPDLVMIREDRYLVPIEAFD